MRSVLPFIAVLALLGSCTDPNTGNKETTKSDTAAAKPIALADVPNSPEFPDAQLSITGMKASPVGTDSAKLEFSFDVKNYELMKQTADASGKQCNNSDKGQHIHFIMDNKPYVALYEPKASVTVPVNTEHYLMCFLSRSYHESVKSPKASVMTHFRINAKGDIQKLDTPKAAPMVFYSRPKGDYLGKDTANVLLDFYPMNANLGSDYMVKADIKNETSGKSASFTIKEWKAKFLQNLGTGKCSVTLSLVDKNGNAVAGPNTTITRTINLAASEPMK